MHGLPIQQKGRRAVIHKMYTAYKGQKTQDAETIKVLARLVVSLAVEAVTTEEVTSPSLRSIRALVPAAENTPSPIGRSRKLEVGTSPIVCTRRLGGNKGPPII
jgi:hypothetical protein